MSILRKTVLAFAATGALALTGAAQAQPKLVTTSPAKDAIVATPVAIRLEFSQDLNPSASTASLMTLSGTDVPVTAKVTGRAMDVTPKAPLGPGAYMVMWQAAGSDGRKVSGDYNFMVR